MEETITPRFGGYSAGVLTYTITMRDDAGAYATEPIILECDADVRRFAIDRLRTWVRDGHADPLSARVQVVRGEYVILDAGVDRVNCA